MEFLTFLLCVFVVSAVLKQPTTNSGNFTPIVPGYELPDRQYEKGPGFSQVSSVSVTVDNTVLPSDMDDFSEQYDQENTDVEFINRLRSGMETKERIQQYSTETAEAEMEYLEQWYDKFSVTREEAKLDTHTPQSETNTTVGNKTSVFWMENKPLPTATALLKLVKFMIILIIAAIITTSMWSILRHQFTFISGIIHTVRYRSADFVTVKYNDTFVI
ncbi:uncharacterized protein LOC126298714 [Schistocerca gregaria]|uniref:uncharacterized protein LOC126298714 n=1 Tax=Schistocerca gregaria TaxID=7010 RepID=UPI00211F114B|nr:uncharacterized protein LOC126298714 [Schistocerca gregaria]